MKALIISDTHGYLENAKKVIKKFDDISVIIHLGDTIEDAAKLKKEFFNKEFYCVAGNNDFTQIVPYERVIVLQGKKIGLTHGHKQRVSYGVFNIELWAQERGADAAIFGHTHVPFCDESGVVYLFNPGSISQPRSTPYPTFAILEISQNGRMFFSLYMVLPSGEIKKIKNTKKTY